MLPLTSEAAIVCADVSIRLRIVGEKVDRPWSSRLVVSVSVAEEPASMTGLPWSQDSSIF